MQCGCITGIAAAVAAMSGLVLTGVAPASTARPAANPNRGYGRIRVRFLNNGSHILNYDLETVNGHYLAAVGGGGAHYRRNPLGRHTIALLGEFRLTGGGQ
jgi:hypothetical protein